MRIAVVCAGESPVPPVDYGGAERITDATVWHLARRGHDIDLYAAPGSACPAVRIVEMPRTGTGQLTANEPWTLRTLRAEHEQRPYDAVWDTAGDHLVSQQADLPAIGRMGGDPFGLFPHDAVRNRVYNSPEFAAFNRCPNHPVARNAFARDPAALPLGSGGGDYALYVGVIHPMKGLLLAMEACKAAGLRFIVAGPIRPAFKHIGDELARRGAEYYGVLSSDTAERTALFGGATVFLHMTQCIDADPIAPKEAAVYGTPIVAAKNGGISSFVLPGFSGYFGWDVADTAEAIKRAAKLDRATVRAVSLPQVDPVRLTDQVEVLCRRVAAGERW